MIITKNLFDKAIRELLYSGLTNEEFEQVREPIMEGNRHAAMAWSVSASLFWILSLLLSLNSNAYAACRRVYGGALVICILTFLCALLVRKFPWMHYPAMYLCDISLLSAGIGIAMCQPDVRTCTMIAAAIIVPVCFIERTAILIALHAVTIVSYALLAKDIIEPVIYSWGLTNLLIFSTAGLMIGHVINKARYERYVYAASAEKLAQIERHYAYHDQMTDLKNRRAYSEDVERINADMPEEFCVVIADVNGLKVTNDTLGHDAGDELIKGAAECLGKAFEGIGTLYRIGGDEFCILSAGQREQTEQGMLRLEQITADWKGTLLKKISISAGISYGRPDVPFDELFEEADSRMYEHKRNYYKLHENENGRP